MLIVPYVFQSRRSQMIAFHCFLKKMIGWEQSGDTWAGNLEFLENGREQKPL